MTVNIVTWFTNAIRHPSAGWSHSFVQLTTRPVKTRTLRAKHGLKRTCATTSTWWDIASLPAVPVLTKNSAWPVKAFRTPWKRISQKTPSLVGTFFQSHQIKTAYCLSNLSMIGCFLIIWMNCWYSIPIFLRKYKCIQKQLQLKCMNTKFKNRDSIIITQGLQMESGIIFQVLEEHVVM